MTACTLGLQVRISVSVGWMWLQCSWIRPRSTATNSWSMTSWLAWTPCCEMCNVSDVPRPAGHALLTRAEKSKPWRSASRADGLQTLPPSHGACARLRGAGEVSGGILGCREGRAKGAERLFLGITRGLTSVRTASPLADVVPCSHLPSESLGAQSRFQETTSLLAHPLHPPPSLSSTMRSRGTAPHAKLESIASFVKHSFCLS